MSSEDFKSFVVTDPDILDEGIDISGLRKTTDTSPLLLGDLQPGLRYDPTLQSSYSDLLQYFSGGLPMLPEPPAVVPPATGGGGTGGEGQATAPITGDSTATPIIPIEPGTFTAESLDESFAGEEGPITQPVTGGITSDPIEMENIQTFENPYDVPMNVDDPGASIENLLQPNVPGTIKGAVDPQPVRTILGPDGITYDAVTGQPIVDDPTTRLPQLGSVTEEDLVDNRNLLQKLGLPADFDLKKAAIEAGINLAVGVPISLIARGLEAVLPGGIQNTTNVARETGLLTGDSTVTQDKYGINTQSQFGNYDQYNIEQVDKLQNRLDELNPDTNPDSKYKTQEDYLKNTKRLRQELEDRNKYLDAKGLTGVGDVDSGRGSGLRPTADDATGVNPFANIDTGVGEFDTTPTKQLTSTDLPYDTQFEDMADVENIGLSSRADINTTDEFIVPFEGARTVIKNPNYIEPGGTILEDDFDDVDLDLFDTTPVDTTPIDTTVTGTLGPPSEISGPQVTEEKPVDIELADNRAVRELNSDQIIEYENLTNQLEGQEMQKTGNPDIGLFKQEEIKNKAIDQIKEEAEFSDEAFMVGDTSTAAPTTGDSGVDSFFDAVDTTVGGGGGRDRDPDPSPSFDPGQGFVDTGGGGEFDTTPSKPSGPTYGPPSQSGGGGNGGSSSGGGGCVIATHAVNSGAFTKDIKREAVRWCVKNLHRTWWGEAIRRGYRYYGQKAIEEGKAKNHYQEFKDYVAFGTGKRRTLKTGWTFVYRSIQFFIRGLING